MENQLQIFENEEFGTVRTLLINNEPLFCLPDVCKSLDLRVDGVIARLKDEAVSIQPIADSLGRIQMTNFVNEDGLYDVILYSRKPQARKFRKWITSEVLPTIRKQGIYSTADIVNKLFESAKAAENIQNLKCVYVFEMSNNTVKIGYTQNVRKRMQTIISSSGLEIVNAYCTKFFDSEIAYLIEQICHETFDAWRVRGEFFKISFADACIGLDKIFNEISSKYPQIYSQSAEFA